MPAAAVTGFGFSRGFIEELRAELRNLECEREQVAAMMLPCEPEDVRTRAVRLRGPILEEIEAIRRVLAIAGEPGSCT